MQIEEDVLLAPLTTFNIGGPAKFFVRARTVEDIKEALAFAKEKSLKIFVLGGGSNVLVPDDGFDGLVIKNELRGMERDGDTYLAAAGEPWDALCARAAGDGLWGLENLSGIPGTVGGAVVQNIGAYGAALSQMLQWVEVLDTALGEVRHIPKSECAFGYRTSIYKQEPGRHVVLRAAFKLSATAVPNIGYRDLADHFAGTRPGLADIRAAILLIRSQKFPDLSQEGTAGSFFLNPTVPAAAAQELKERYPDMPLFAMPETSAVKVPLGWILDRVLNLRGYRLGEVRLFEKQALVIVATRSAKACDVRLLADKIKKEVQEKIGMAVQEEVKII